MYEIFEKLMFENGVNASDVSKATGIARSNFTDWKKGRATPKLDKLKRIAEYFSVPLEVFTDKEYSFDYSDQSEKTTQRVKVAGEALKFPRNGYVEGYPVYYTNEETAKAAQEVFDNPDTRMLFDAAKGSRPENIRLAAEMLKRFKETNPDG